MPHDIPATTHIVLALDLSKTSTGYAIASQNAVSGEGQMELIGTIVPRDAARKSKWFHPVVTEVIARLEGVVSEFGWFRDRAFTLAVEANTFGQSFSEFQFYLGQEVQRWASNLGVDVVTYSNGMIKSWARQWSCRTDLPTRLEKPEMEDIWRKELRPRNPDMFPSSILVTDDAIDAGWLALLALHAQAHILVDPAAGSAPPLWNDGEPFRDAFLKRKLNQLSNIATPDLSRIFTNMRGNKHLGLAAPSFLPFGALDRLARYVRWESRQDPVGCFNHLLARLGRSTTKKALTAALETGAFSFCLDRSGGLLLVPNPSGDR